jgi:tRNA dimethylallyltransferase
MKKSLHIITGPTAVGKSDFALSYAQKKGAEIVSCDASLVYRGMDIGTAKPSGEDRARVPHHLIDLHSVDQIYDIMSYVKDAQAAVADIFARGKSVVVTGGSGFYLKSFFAPVIDAVKVSDLVRAEVDKLYRINGLDGLLEELHRRSPQGVGNLDINNPRRVLRALERCIASGKSLPVLQTEFAARPEPYIECKKHYILLERDRENLKKRVVHRADLMLRNGLIEEVEALLNEGIQENPSAASAIGYRETIAFLEGHIKHTDLLPAIVKNTRHLIKKQLTWFRTQIRPADEVVTM